MDPEEKLGLQKARQINEQLDNILELAAGLENDTARRAILQGAFELAYQLHALAIDDFREPLE